MASPVSLKKTVRVAVAPAGVPVSLREQDRWLLWKMDSGGHKVPFACSRLDRRCDANNPANWSPFALADSTRADGIGYALGPLPDGQTISGIDLDDCRDPQTGVIEPWALNIVVRVNSYTEVSPTGTGLKIFVFGAIAEDASQGKIGRVEIYSRSRYFTVTGQHLESTPTTVEHRETALRDLHSQVWSGDPLALAALFGLEPREKSDEWVNIWCPWQDSHSSQTEHRESALRRDAKGNITGFECFHASCSERTIGDVFKFLGYKTSKVKRQQEQDDEIEAAVADINQTNAVVWTEGGSILVLTEEFDRHDKRHWIRFSTPPAMSIVYPQPYPLGRRMVPLGDVWLRHPSRRFYRGITLDPTAPGHRDDLYNLWRGFSVEPQKGEWPLFRQHISHLVKHNEDHARYVLAWMAETVKNPADPIGIALTFRGKPGTGKGIFCRWFGSLFGSHFIHLASEETLLGRFNGHLHNAVVVFADEAVWAGGKQGLGALKRMITEPTVNIERKHVDTVTVPNHIHMLIASNEAWVVPADWDDRRFAVFGTDPDRKAQIEKDDSALYKALRAEMFDRGGLAAMLYDLLELKSTVNLRQIPETDDRKEQAVLTARFDERWWFEKLQDGYFTYATSDAEGRSEIYEQWPRALAKDVVHESFLTFLDKHRAPIRGLRATQTELGAFLKKRCGLLDDRRREGDSLVREWVFPSLAECRARWAKESGWTTFEWGEYEP
ncbi:MAG: DUF5906 domain-containing protein [Vicinamibacterales bacterium]